MKEAPTRRPSAAATRRHHHMTRSPLCIRYITACASRPDASLRLYVDREREFYPSACILALSLPTVLVRASRIFDRSRPAARLVKPKKCSSGSRVGTDQSESQTVQVMQYYVITKDLADATLSARQKHAKAHRSSTSKDASAPDHSGMIILRCAFDRSRSSITIAIVGGGIGGVCCAIALGRLGYDVHLFEQAAKFSEIGAGVGLGPNSLNALRMIGIGDEYEKVADITESNAIWFQWVKWDNGESFGKTTASGKNSSVHRARLLEALLPLLPPNVTSHFSAHVTAAETISSTRVRLTIQRPAAHPQGSQNPEWPGSQDTFEASICIGCDGIKSSIRKSLGLDKGFEEEGGGKIRYTGTYAYRGLLDVEKAVEKNGEKAKEPTMWFGKDKHILTFPIEEGKVLNLVAFVSDRSQGINERQWTGPWVKPVAPDVMFDDFKGWDQNVLNLLSLIEKPDKWALHELVPLDQWTVDRITLLGDSAHASLPHNGAGAGQATEDVYVLWRLLARPECNDETLPAFLEAYEGVRRPRASAQQVFARESGDEYEMAGKYGSDWKALGEHLNVRYKWIWEHDLEKDADEALEWLVYQGIVKSL